MDICVNNKQKQLAEETVHKVTDRISTAFYKFGDNIISVELTAEDVNGPRGGIDKECRLLVRLKKMENVIVTVREESHSKAISRAIDRAQRSVTRKVQRRMLRNNNLHSRLGFANYR